MSYPTAVRNVAIASLILTVEAVPCALILSGCVVGTPRLADGVPGQVRTERLSLGADTLEIALGMPSSPDPGRPLVVLVSGDGGWRPSERVVFEALVRAGYQVAGVSAHAYLDHLGFQPTATDDVARDLEAIGSFAQRALGRAEDAPFVLAGVSRGAGLAATAAVHTSLRQRLTGLLAVALTGDEEYVFHRRRHRHGWRGESSSGTRPAVDPYSSLARLGHLPVVVIQSTHDGYLPASDARQRFGDDTPWRRFVALEASNHSFGGAREQMAREVEKAIAWILSATDAPEAVDSTTGGWRGPRARPGVGCARRVAGADEARGRSGVGRHSAP